MSRTKFLRIILLQQTFIFLVLIAWCWADEAMGLAPSFSANSGVKSGVLEALHESFTIGLVGMILVILTHRVFNRALSEESIIPTCAFCKCIREGNDWQPMEEYFSRRLDASFSHGFCPHCLEKHYRISEKGLMKANGSERLKKETAGGCTI